MLTEKISPYWKTLIERLEGALSLPNSTSKSIESSLNAIRAQIVFSEHENVVLESETSDPLGAECHTISNGLSQNRLVHQYKNRCLFLATGSCFAHCRYCFRRASNALQLPFASGIEIKTLCDYVSKNNDIKEVLITGGDPLSTSDAKLEELLKSLRDTKSDVVIRLATRAPIFAPSRITDEFVSMLQNYKPLWVIPHINHPVEISKDFAIEAHRVLEKCINAGIPMQSQTVLLRGINDSVEDLSMLFNELIILGIKPGYLFQGDMAPGTSHFRLPIDEAIDLYKNLCVELSGLSTPVFAVDLPHGGGKVNMLQLTKRQYLELKNLYG